LNLGENVSEWDGVGSHLVKPSGICEINILENQTANIKRFSWECRREIKL